MTIIDHWIRGTTALGDAVATAPDFDPPDGVFNVVYGDKTAVHAIVDYPDLVAVSFVGSTPIAQYIHERGIANGKRVQALGGAENHAADADADIDFAADNLAAAAFGSASERCMAISAAVAVGGAGDPIVEAVNARLVKVGPRRADGSEMGPVVTRVAQERIVGLINTGADQGASVTVDGRDLEVADQEGGFFVGPTVIDNVTTEMDVYREEILINSDEAACAFQRGVDVAMIGINVPVPVPMAFYSVGGRKASLFGDKHAHGPEGVSIYTRAKAMTGRWPRTEHASDASFHFPTSK